MRKAQKSRKCLRQLTLPVTRLKMPGETVYTSTLRMMKKFHYVVSVARKNGDPVSRIKRCGKLRIVTAGNSFQRPNDLDEPRFGFVSAAHEFPDIKNEADRVVISADRTLEHEIASRSGDRGGEPHVWQIDPACPVGQR